MWLRWLIIVCFLSIVTPSNAQGPNTQEIIHDSYGTHKRHENYKTKDILLLFKSCYETIYFLGNTKYKRSKNNTNIYPKFGAEETEKRIDQHEQP